MRIRVRKNKWPCRPVSEWDAEVLGVDEFGTWLFCAKDETYRTPDGTEVVIPSDGVQLMPSTGWWAAWWWRMNHWISVDVCLPPVLDRDGWSFTDLELDLVRREDGTVLLVDEDEFEQAVAEYDIPVTVVETSRATTAELRARLADDADPLLAKGWEWLDSAH